MIHIEEVKKRTWLFLNNLEADRDEFYDPLRAGKYMFFSDDKKALINIARDILNRFNLYSAKVPLTDTPKPDKGFGFVLCVYDSSPRYIEEMKQFADENIIKYRRWKSNEDTLRGKYSEAFLKSKEIEAASS